MRRFLDLLLFGTTQIKIHARPGVYFDLLNPDHKLIELDDIATALSKICRFGGRCYDHYSVAEHCFAGAEYAWEHESATDAQVRAYLLHDAAEAYVGDVVTPLKTALGRRYKIIEDRVSRAIGFRFGVNFDKHEKFVKKIDLQMRFAEKRKLGCDTSVWDGEHEVKMIDSKVSIVGYSHFRAKEMFLDSCYVFGVGEDVVPRR